MAQNLSQALKEIRESRGISLEEIAQKTHIHIEYLEAIESDDEEALPSHTHKRGFLRLYASELGVEFEELKAKRYHLYKEKPLTSETSLDEIQSPQIKPQDTESSIEPETVVGITQETLIPASYPDSILDEKPVEAGNAPARKSSLIFKSIGEILRNRRELLSLSTEDITEYIHIRKYYLFAMETGQFDRLPSPVQARGMLANYAEFLNLNVDSLLLQFADGLQMKRIEKTQLSKQQTKQTTKEISTKRLQLKNFFSLDLLVIIVLFIGFASFVIWGVNRILSVNSTSLNSTQLPEVADILLATGSPTPQLSLTPDLAEYLQGTEMSDQGEPTPIFTPVQNNSPINILIIPRQRAWVQITTDSELTFEGRLSPGNAYDYSGSESVEILTGNAGALQIYFNEQDVGSLGLVGQVIDLIFTEDGLILPTPTNTPTITETMKASPTPTFTPSPTNTAIPTDTLQPTATATQNDD
ncbi:MAG: DUF4115 domain-containing protein [Chloroflexota bacterium]|nr:DUF4115 domain-containing protein [Chloroflexota bacterium]